MPDKNIDRKLLFTIPRSPEIRHISFDLRLTLIKSNPEFGQKRAEMFKKEFNLPQEPEELIRLFRTVTKSTDELEKKGIGFTSLEIIAKALTKFGIHLDEYPDDILETTYQKCENIFLENIPTLIDDNIIPTLQGLKDNGYTLNLMSNTGSTSGATMRKVMDVLGISSYMEFMLFSDELGVSKPNPKVFQAIVEGLDNRYDTTQIMHVGDNNDTDVKGAHAFGMTGLLVDNFGKNGYKTSDLLIDMKEI